MIFRLADAAMYDQMEKKTHTPVIDRAIALNKMIRLLTLAAGGDGYLDFMGNEFGHPEWIDFPRPGNGNSFHDCLRQWSLLRNHDLKYEDLNAFDCDMIDVIKKHDAFAETYPTLKWLHEDDKVIAFERGGLVFVFNFAPEKSYEGYVIPVSAGEDHDVLFTSDDYKYGGFGRIAHESVSAYVPGREGNNLRLYLPARTCIVLCPHSLNK